MDKNISVNDDERRRRERRRDGKGEVLGGSLMRLDSALFLAAEEVGPGGKGYMRISEARAELGRLASALRRICPDVKPLYSGPRLAPSPGAEKASRLTPKEREIVAFITEGMADKDIARKLGISINTVHAHRNNIARKLDIHKQTDLVRFAIQERLVRV